MLYGVVWQGIRQQSHWLCLIFCPMLSCRVSGMSLIRFFTRHASTPACSWLSTSNLSWMHTVHTRYSLRLHPCICQLQGTHDNVGCCLGVHCPVGDSVCCTCSLLCIMSHSVCVFFLLSVSFKYISHRKQERYRWILREHVNECPSRTVYRLNDPSSENTCPLSLVDIFISILPAVPFHYITFVYVLFFSTLRMAVQHLQGWTGEYLCLICWNQKQVSSSFCTASQSPQKGVLKFIQPSFFFKCIFFTWKEECVLPALELAH